MIHTIAGDTLSFKAELVDGETDEPVAGAAVEDVRVAMGSLRFTLSSPEVTLDEDAVRVSLSREQTEALDGFVKVYIKVRLVDGRISTVVRGESIKFSRTPLTRSG